VLPQPIQISPYKIKTLKHPSLDNSHNTN